MTIRVGIGCALTVGAQTSIKPNFLPAAANFQKQFTDAAASYLDSTYTSYVFTPTVTVALGWRFFPWLTRGW